MSERNIKKKRNECKRNENMSFCWREKEHERHQTNGNNLVLLLLLSTVNAYSFHDSILSLMAFEKRVFVLV